MDLAAALFGMGDGSRVTVWLAKYVSRDGATVQCDVSNGDAVGRVSAQTMSEYRPSVGEQVWLLAVTPPDGGVKFYYTGPVLMPPPVGTVVSAASDYVTVDTDAGQVQATYNQGDTLSASQKVRLVWSDGAHVVGVLSTNPLPVEPPAPPPSAGPSTHVDTFTAIDAGSFSGGRWWQPWASDSTLGAWFFGSKVRDTLRGAPVSRIEMWVNLASKFGAAPNIGTHPHDVIPGGAPAIANARPIPVTSGTWLELPVEFGQTLSDGSAAGIGLAHGGFNKFAALAADAQSGALRITSTY
ncbi:hypothetical protein HUN58_14685 [Curtobacterium sp. Csp1]|uniref:hypothetical protein n=1 Tax=Curtobacterium sp. Csp1 TaxID=2495429 RepID=UPI00159A88A6|nr:hypothetical protein [Curtobacterium sp. Csp1]QKS21000.1 hypothetical protein HUN58_14685 [Curtobacterium sp. Csp1]